MDVSISMVESTCESAVGKGRDSRCNGSEDEGAWRMRSGCMGGAGREVANTVGGPVLEDVREVLSRWQT